MSGAPEGPKDDMELPDYRDDNQAFDEFLNYD